MASPPSTSKSVSSEKQTLRAFTQDFFEQFGAGVQPVDQQPLGPLRVTLAAEVASPLVSHFGGDRLTLAFQQADIEALRDAEHERVLDEEVAASALDDDAEREPAAPRARPELVAYGSQLFDRMVNYMQRHAALTVQTLPARFRDGETLMQAVRPTNAAIAGLQMRETQQPLYLFNWRITYRADDQREELYTVVLEENGSRVPLASEIQDEMASGKNVDAPTAGEKAAVDLPALLADAESAIEQNEEGHVLPLKSPPMTELTRLATSARKYAIYHADLRCASHEAEILPRLHKSLERLTSYYEQQVEEIHDNHDAGGEKRRVLEQDLQRKLAEEVENHRLRVRVDLVSYAILLVPVAVAEVTLRAGRASHSLSPIKENGKGDPQEVTVTVRRNSYSGVLRRPRCHACRTETAAVAIDRNGHITCDDCLQQCAVCRDVLCAACGVEPCTVCERDVCDACGSACWACGERACAKDQSPCPTCGDAVCHSCQTECAECDTRQCRSHLRRDSVSEALICGACAVRCPGCQQFSARIGTDEASGQRFCEHCLVACTECGRRVGPGFFITGTSVGQGTGRPYCTNCTDPCPDCGTQLPRGELCPACNAVCAICGGAHLREATAVCVQCEQPYCTGCVGEASGLCRTCTALDDGGGEPVDLLAEPCALDSRVEEIAPLYEWRRAENARCTVYTGKGMLAAGGLVVAEKVRAGGSPKLLIVRQQGLADLLRRFGIKT